MGRGRIWLLDLVLLGKRYKVVWGWGWERGWEGRFIKRVFFIVRVGDGFFGEKV